jgi:hypothetical protein
MSGFGLDNRLQNDVRRANVRLYEFCSGRVSKNVIFAVIQAFLSWGWLFGLAFTQGGESGRQSSIIGINYQSIDILEDFSERLDLCRDFIL